MEQRTVRPQRFLTPRRAARRGIPATASSGDGPAVVVAAPERTRPEEPDEANRPGVLPVAAALVVLAVVGVGVPIVIAHHYGALGIPRGDDWSYVRTLFHWTDTGHLNFNNWVSMTLLGQLALAAPIVKIGGHHITSLQVLAAVLGFGGLAAVLSIGLSLGRRVWVATFVALLVAVAPPWGVLSATFLTDVPAFGVSMIAVAIGVRALARRPVSMPLLTTSLLVGFFGFTIREYAAVPVIALVFVTGWIFLMERDLNRLRSLALLALALALGAVLFLAFWHTIPDSKPYRPHFPDEHAIKTAVYKGGALLRLLGLTCAPALLLARPWRIIRRSWSLSPDTTIFVALGTAAWLAFTAHEAPRIAFAGNYISPDGILARSVSIGPRPDIFSSGVWNAMLAVGTIGAVLLVFAALPFVFDLGQRAQALDPSIRDPKRAYLVLAVVGYALAYGAAGLLGLPLYDRYLMPMIPLTALLLLSTGPAASDTTYAVRSRQLPWWRIAATGVAFAALAAVGLAFTLDSAAFDSTRWHLAEAVTRQGWSPRQVNGGFEWINFHAKNPGVQGRRQLRGCVRVVVNPRPVPPGRKRRIIASAQYTGGFHEPVRVIAVRNRRPCVPGQPDIRP